MSDTLSVPDKSTPKTERKVSVKLLSDVWIANPEIEGGIERIRTNIPDYNSFNC
jgi:hypothetical protein